LLSLFPGYHKLSSLLHYTPLPPLCPASGLKQWFQ
jgi:hypothetical protein